MSKPPPRPNRDQPKLVLPAKLFDGFTRVQLVNGLIDQNKQMIELENRAVVAENRLSELEGGAKGNPSDLPAMVDAAAFIAEALEEPAQLVSGLLHQGSKLVLGGGSKSFKTWTLLDLGLSVAHGAPWLGFATNRGRVLFLNFEIQPHAWQRRVEKVAQAKGIQIEAGAVTFWNLRGKAADYKILLPRISERCRSAGFSLIILDPIYKLYGNADENKAGDIAALLNGLESLAVETGAAIAFAAHFSKGNQANKSAMDRISGSGVFARDPDSILIFTELKDGENAFAVESILRNFAPVEPFAVRWAHPIFTRDSELNPKRLKQTGGRKPEHTPDDLLKTLPEDGLTNPQWEKAANKAGIARAIYFRLRKSLIGLKQIVQVEDGRWMRKNKEAS
jgi:hypothetical protein